MVERGQKKVNRKQNSTNFRRTTNDGFNDEYVKTVVTFRQCGTLLQYGGKTVQGKSGVLRNSKNANQPDPNRPANAGISEKDAEIYGFLNDYYRSQNPTAAHQLSAINRYRFNKLWWGAKKARLANSDLTRAANMVYKKFTPVDIAPANMRSLNSPKGGPNFNKALFTGNQNCTLASALTTVCNSIQGNQVANSIQPKTQMEAQPISITALGNNSAAELSRAHDSYSFNKSSPSHQLYAAITVDNAETCVSGTRLLPCKPGEGKEKWETMDLNQESKKQIIRTMLKEKKIPEKVVSEHMESVKTILNEEERINKLTEAILLTYDIIVQEVQPRPSTGSSNRNPFARRPSTRGTYKRGQINTKVPAGQHYYNGASNSSPLRFPPTVASPHPPKKEEKKMNLATYTRTMDKKLVKAGTQKGSGSPDKNKTWNLGRAYHLNELINDINKYTSLTTRNKDKHYDLKAVNTVHRKLGLGKVFQNEEEIKSKERLSQIKETLLRMLYHTINKENGLNTDSTPEQSVTMAPKYFVGGGNNSPLVMAMMRERWWWIPANDMHEANLLWTQWRKMEFINTLKPLVPPEPKNVDLPGLPRLCNHLEGNYYFGNKKSMYKSLLLYCELLGKDVLEIVPLTFHITKGKTDESYAKFKFAYMRNEEEKRAGELYKNALEEEDEDVEESEAELEPEKGKKIVEEEGKNVWIIKPGENTNRGSGIMIAQDLHEIENIIVGDSHTFIIQKYIERPLLYEKRKFDIRCFALITSINGYIKGYYYQEGY